jgi:hypothetical protein
MSVFNLHYCQVLYIVRSPTPIVSHPDEIVFEAQRMNE